MLRDRVAKSPATAMFDEFAKSSNRNSRRRSELIQNSRPDNGPSAIGTGFVSRDHTAL